ncbi:IS982 family transposase [Tessaracoccus caeni]|uniref:IS982 family transposase n=1 Tax=Tessaracoccus caeni TaxID=3031239 RepID=UPI0023DA8033|nr:IS982 family transposase [Tessaracoccus caeni]MDF1489972.1 IS982 family transposase [Tessaracoccus caeni]
MDADLDTLATALYVTCDDLLKAHPEQLPPRPVTGFHPRITDAELVTLAVIQALLQIPKERRFLRYAHRHLIDMFPDLPGQSSYNRRLRALAGTMAWLTTQLAAATSVFTDDLWIVDSTPIECGRSKETVKRSDLAGWAEYGYCASHSRFFWGLRLHLVATRHGLPIAWALSGAKADERDVFEDMLGLLPPELTTAVATDGQTTMGDKNYFGRQFEQRLNQGGITVLRPTRSGEKPRPGGEFFKPLRQVIESIFDTFKDQLDLERHNARTAAGVLTRIATRILALTTAIWHNDRIGAPVLRSLTAYDH